MLAHDARHDREAEAGADAWRLRGEKRIEYACQNRIRDSRSIVAVSRATRASSVLAGMVCPRECFCLHIGFYFRNSATHFELNTLS
jgi:hypothetical protein